jgi:molybdopterin molybdotransferase
VHGGHSRPPRLDRADREVDQADHRQQHKAQPQGQGEVALALTCSDRVTMCRSRASALTISDSASEPASVKVFKGDSAPAVHPGCHGPRDSAQAARQAACRVALGRSGAARVIMATMSDPLGPSPLTQGDRQLSVAEARAAIHARLAPLALDVEAVPLRAGLQRVLAHDLVSPIDVPPHDNSAMDGFAFGGAAITPQHGLMLRLVGTAYAGRPFDGHVGPGECVRIMTGAVMPAGLDTVVPQELASLADGVVAIPPGTVARGENRRRAGEDLPRGQPALRAGRVLRPADLGLAASLGIETLLVRRRLRVALFSTGDEVTPPGQPLPPGGIYDSNRFSLAGAIERLGFEVLDLGLVRDDPPALEAVLARATAVADVVVTSGGVSVGEADHTRATLERLGQVAFWKVAMRPGRPFAFGPLHRREGDPAWLFALPGNPVAALVTFYAFARDALQVLAGATPTPPPLVPMRSATPIRKRPGRTEFQRAVVERGPDGGWQVRLTGSQGAGILRSLSEAQALVVLGHDQGSVGAGEMVDVWLFEGLV